MTCSDIKCNVNDVVSNDGCCYHYDDVYSMNDELPNGFSECKISDNDYACVFSNNHSDRRQTMYCKCLSINDGNNDTCGISQQAVHRVTDSPSQRNNTRTTQSSQSADVNSERCRDRSVVGESCRSSVAAKVSSGQSVFNESLFGAPLSDDSSDSATDSREEWETDTERERGSGEGLNNTARRSFLHWNVNGLMTKIYDNDFVNFVLSFDFVCLVETFVESFHFDIFSSHKVFIQPAVKLSHAGRPSGGVVCLIRKELVSFVKQIKVNGNVLLFVINKILFGFSKDILYVCAYVPPEGSGYYAFFGEGGDGIDILENCMFENILEEKDVYVILSGDLNGRTSHVSQPIDIDDDLLETLYVSRPSTAERKSQDVAFNAFGKSLLSMCTALNLCILNGICQGDREGRYTYISPFGSSVIDYFLMSCDLFALVSDSCFLKVMDRVESSHMPISLTINSPENIIDVHDSRSLEFIEKFCWDQALVNQYVNLLSCANSRSLMEEAIRFIDVDVNVALRKFTELIKISARDMKKRICVNGRKYDNGWFDKECRDYRKKVRKALKDYRKTLKEEDRFNFCKIRREYKHFLNIKKKAFNARMIDRLVGAINDQKEFWDVIHNAMPRKGFVKSTISENQWFEHFKGLLDKEELLRDIEDNDVDTFADEDREGENDLPYNGPISEEEVIRALRKLKMKKATGPDGLAGEFFKSVPELLLPFFVKIFNALFDRGVYPDQWTESIILPLHKKGDVNNPSNYRGISLSDVSSKIYGTIINSRLQSWVEQNNITGEFQAGFKKGYSTIDHMFTLMACIQKQLSLHRKLYVAFIDFEKCFDSINRNLLWPILKKKGVRGKLFRSIRSMYLNVRSRVRSGKKLTELIQCTSGVKQGDSCSPVLFSIFINELAVEVIEQGKHGVNFLVDILELFILLLADDVILLSETPIGLQRQLNSLQSSATALGLKVNLGKSNIVVFRNGGYLGAAERWTFQGEVMPIVNAYKYLGIYFSTRLSFTGACKDIASKAKRVFFMIMQRLRRFNNSSFQIFIKLFDTQVQPIMQYGSEIWGLNDATEQCEKVHLFALKKFLFVKLTTPNNLVYKELNRYPIVINSIIRCISYWLKLMNMDDNRIPKKAYLMLHRLDVLGKRNWVTNIREFLLSNGFGDVWMNQGVVNEKCFVRVLRQRLIDCWWQNWNVKVSSSDRYLAYNKFCAHSLISLPTYLQIDLDRHVKWLMTKFRFGISDLLIHHYRYRNKDNAVVYLCPLCKLAEDNELHFVLCCPALFGIRKSLIAAKYYRSPCDFRLTLLMTCSNPNTVRNLCFYLYRAFKLRELSAS